jgi:hypothetical protein
VLTRLVQLAMRWIFSDQPLEHLERLIALIDQIADRDTALQILESLLRYYVQGTQRVEEDDARRLLEQTAPGDPLIQTFIDSIRFSCSTFPSVTCGWVVSRSSNRSG